MNHIDTSTEAVERLMDGVTPGPWAGDPRFSTIVAGEKCIAEVFTSDADASFITAARDLVPALLAERDALKAERDEAIEGWHVIHPNITVQDAAKVLLTAREQGQIDVEAVKLFLKGQPVAALRAIAEGRA